MLFGLFTKHKTRTTIIIKNHLKDFTLSALQTIIVCNPILFNANMRKPSKYMFQYRHTPLDARTRVAHNKFVLAYMKHFRIYIYTIHYFLLVHNGTQCNRQIKYIKRIIWNSDWACGGWHGSFMRCVIVLTRATRTCPPPHPNITK